MVLSDVIGPTLLSKDGTVETSNVDNQVVAFYFSAHWCPPCKEFTKVLVPWYKRMKEAGKDIEIVFLSSDHDKNAFTEYYGEMPWLAVPYEDREIKNQLSGDLNVQGIPTLVFADKEGNVYQKDARSVVLSDPEGESFPWIPPTLEEALGAEFIRNDGTVVKRSEFQNKHVALYFSAEWCPPCRNFTLPVLKPAYEKAQELGKEWEIIFVSADRSEDKFKEYFGEMPWLAIPFSDQKRINELNQYFEVDGIPALVMLDPELNVVNEAARNPVTRDSNLEDFPWHPKPVLDLEEHEKIDEGPSMIILMEKEGAGTKAQFEAIINDAATEHKAEQNSKKLFFAQASSEGQFSKRIREICKLDPFEGTRTLCNGDVCMKLDNSTAVIIIDTTRGGFYLLDGDLKKDNILGFRKAFFNGELTSSFKSF